LQATRTLNSFGPIEPTMDAAGPRALAAGRLEQTRTAITTTPCQTGPTKIVMYVESRAVGRQPTPQKNNGKRTTTSRIVDLQRTGQHRPMPNSSPGMRASRA